MTTIISAQDRAEEKIQPRRADENPQQTKAGEDAGNRAGAPNHQIQQAAAGKRVRTKI